MKFLYTLFFILFSVITNAQQYRIVYDENDNFSLLKGEKKLDVTVKENYFGFFELTDNKGRTAIVQELENDNIFWLSSFLPTDSTYTTQLLNDLSMIISIENDKYGLVNTYNQTEVYPPELDSIYFDEYSMECTLFKDGELCIINSYFLGQKQSQSVIQFYDSMYSVQNFYDYAWDDDDTYLCVKNGKKGVITYIEKYDEKADTYDHSLKNIIPIEMDDIYYDQSQELFFATKDGLITDFDPYSETEWNVVPKYSAVHRDMDSYEVVRVASIEGFKNRYLDLQEIEMFRTYDAVFYLFEGENGNGLYWLEKDTLIVPMIYDEITHRNGYLEVKKDGYYAYLSFNHYDYEFIGIDTNTFFVHEKPALDRYLTENESLNITVKGTSLKLDMCPYSHGECLNGKPLINFLNPKDSPAEQLEALVKERQESDFWGRITEAEYEDVGIKAQVLSPTKSYIAYAAKDISQLQAIRDSFFLASRAEMLQIELNEENLYNHQLSYGGSAMTFWKGKGLAYYIDGKNKTAGLIQVSYNGFYAIYRKRKGVVYDENGNKLIKIKKNEILVDAFKNRFIIEECIVKDSIMRYSLLDENRKEIYSQELHNNNKGWSSDEASLKYLIDTGVENTYYNTPLSFVSDYQGGAALLKRTYSLSTEGASENYYNPGYFNLNAKPLDIKEVEHWDQGGYVKTTTTNSNGLIHGLHDGYQWIIPHQYEEITTLLVPQKNNDKKTYFLTGYQGIYGLTDHLGNEILPCDYLNIEVLRIENNELIVMAVPQNTMKSTTIKIPLSK